MPSVTVVGAQWGDEGKAGIVDLLSADAAWVVRFQGGFATRAEDAGFLQQLRLLIARNQRVCALVAVFAMTFSTVLSVMVLRLQRSRDELVQALSKAEAEQRRAGTAKKEAIQAEEDALHYALAVGLVPGLFGAFAEFAAMFTEGVVYEAYQIYYNWYPQPYFAVDGGWQGIRLIGAVDLVLGPFITFLIFDLRKSRRAILFDLIVIAVIQFGALAYGINLTYNQRPVAIVMIDDFVVGSTMEHYGGTLESADQLKQYSDEKPPIIYAEIPLDQDALAEINRVKIEEKVLENAQMDLYKTGAELTAALKSKQVMFMTRLDEHEQRDQYEAWLKQHGKSEDEVLIARFNGRYGSVWLVFDLDGRYLDYF